MILLLKGVKRGSLKWSNRHADQPTTKLSQIRHGFLSQHLDARPPVSAILANARGRGGEGAALQFSTERIDHTGLVGVAGLVAPIAAGPGGGVDGLANGTVTLPVRTGGLAQRGRKEASDKRQ